MSRAALLYLTDDDLTAMHTFPQTMQPVAHFININNFAESTPCQVCGQNHGLGELKQIELPQGVTIAPTLFDDYVGIYRSEEYGFTIRVTRVGDQLQAQDGPVVDLIPQSDTRFLMVGGLAPLRFVRDETGAVNTLISEEVEALAFMLTQLRKLGHEIAQVTRLALPFAVGAIRFVALLKSAFFSRSSHGRSIAYECARRI